MLQRQTGARCCNGRRAHDAATADGRTQGDAPTFLLILPSPTKYVILKQASVEYTNEYFVYAASTSARQEDVILGEGDAMVFTPLNEAMKLDLSVSAQYMLSLIE